jgi:hypothetical protein
MLTLEAIQSAQALADRLDAARVVVLAAPGTPLEALTSGTRVDDHTGVVQADDGGYSANVQFIHAMANVQNDKLGANPHDVALNEIAEVAIPAVTGHIQFARSTVRPVIEDLVERVMKSLGEDKIELALGAEVIVQESPAPLTNGAFDTMVRKFEGVPYAPPVLGMRCPDQTIDEIKELMKTGSGSVDKDIEAWLAAEGGSWLMELWENVFQIKPREAGYSGRRTFDEWTADKACGVDFSLAIFLLARKLFDSPLEGTVMNLNEHERLVADYRDQSAAALCRFVDQLDRNRKNGILVVGLSRLKTTVDAEVYREWIEKGGENEVLFGNSLRTMPFTSVTDIEAAAAALKGAWDQHAALEDTVRRNRQFDRTRELFFHHFRAQLAEATEDGQADLGNSEQVLERFRQGLTAVREDDLDCLYTLATKLVCDARFPDKAAYTILMGIDRNVKQNPHLELREAATLAIVEYVCDWLSEQFKPVRY